MPGSKDININMIVSVKGMLSNGVHRQTTAKLWHRFYSRGARGCEESTGWHLFAEDLRKGAPVRPRGKRVSKHNTAKCQREYGEKQTLLHCW